MENTWPLQEAKNRFSEVVREAMLHGPQKVTRHGEETVIVLSLKDYKKLSKPKRSLVEFLQKSPLRGLDISIEHNKELGRDVHL
jgi:prevent-host-death family protein